MDVRCQQCGAEYELDEAQVGPRGLAVRCTGCGHVFRVTRPQGAAPPLWRVRRANGDLFSLRELTTLQQWIVEGKIGRDDQIGREGHGWKRLGDIPELAGFFSVVEQARAAGLSQPVDAPELDFDLDVVVDAAPAPAPAPRPPTPPRPEASPPAPAPRRDEDDFTLGGPGALSDEPVWTRGEAEPVLSHARSAARPRRRRWPLVLGGLLLIPVLVLGLGVLLAPGRLADLLADLTAAAKPTPEAPVAAGEEAAPGGEAEAAPEEGEPEELEPVGSPDAAAPEQGDEALSEPAAGGDAAPEATTEEATADEAALDEAEAPQAEAPAAEPAPAAEAEAQPEAEETPAPRDESTPAPPPRPRSFEALVADADRARRAGRLEAALALYDEAIGRDDRRPEPYTGLGWTFIERRQWSSAVASFQAALDRDPSHAAALMGMAEAHRFSGDTEAARTWYRRYLEIHPRGPDARVARNALEAL